MQITRKHYAAAGVAGPDQGGAIRVPAGGRIADYGLIAAAGMVIAALPPATISLALQKVLISGQGTGGVKE